MNCRSCNKNFEHGIMLGALVEKLYGNFNHHSISRGGEPASTTCPQCDRITLIIDEGACASCGEAFLRNCQKCDSEIISSELDLCDYCEYQAEKLNLDVP